MPPETQLRMVMETAHTFDRWETRTSRRDLNAIDGGAVRAFCDDVTSAGRGRFESSAAVPEILGALNLLARRGLPNRGAIALFGRPESFGSEYPVLGCHLAAVDGVDLGEDLRDVRIVEDNVFVSLTRAVDFCQDHLHRPLHINGLQARRRVEIPVEVLREALANAFAHRNYAVAGRVQVRIYSDRLEVVSTWWITFRAQPGRPVRAPRFPPVEPEHHGMYVPAGSCGATRVGYIADDPVMCRSGSRKAGFSHKRKRGHLQRSPLRILAGAGRHGCWTEYQPGNDPPHTG